LALGLLEQRYRAYCRDNFQFEARDREVETSVVLPNAGGIAKTAGHQARDRCNRKLYRRNVPSQTALQAVPPAVLGGMGLGVLSCLGVYWDKTTRRSCYDFRPLNRNCTG